MLFGLRLAPHMLKEIIDYRDNTGALHEALLHLHYAPEAASVISRHPHKFLWPELLKVWASQPAAVVNDCARVLALMEVPADPGALVPHLLDLIDQRRLLLDMLLKVPVIKLTLPRLIPILERLVGLSPTTIAACLAEDSIKWDALSG